MRSPRAIAAEQPIDGRPHVGQQERIVQVGEIGREETAGAAGIVQPALAQQPRDHRRHPERRDRARTRASSAGTSSQMRRCISRVGRLRALGADAGAALP